MSKKNKTGQKKWGGRIFVQATLIVFIILLVIIFLFI